MQKSDDTYVLFLLIIVIVIWLFIAFKRWLYTPKKLKLPFLEDNTVPMGQVVDLLEECDYIVLHGKHRVPITIRVDDKIVQSRFFIDYFAQKGNKVYVVKVKKERQPISLTGSSIRDHLLPYFLLFDDEEIAGVLYIDVNRRKVNEITFHLDKEDRGT